MGRFFTSTQILVDENFTREQFIKDFCSKMKKDCYLSCEEEISEITYVLKYSGGCKWVTLSSEAYEQGNYVSEKDTGRIAKMLGATCINISVADSDYAILDLYDSEGDKIDTAAMGRADDMYGEDIPEADKRIWEPLLCSGFTWGQFCEIMHGNYIFVEEGLSQLAPLIGMDSNNILFEAEDANEKDGDIRFLSFKKLIFKRTGGTRSF